MRQLCYSNRVNVRAVVCSRSPVVFPPHASPSPFAFLLLLRNVANNYFTSVGKLPCTPATLIATSNCLSRASAPASCVDATQNATRCRAFCLTSLGGTPTAACNGQGVCFPRETRFECLCDNGTSPDPNFDSLICSEPPRDLVLYLFYLQRSYRPLLSPFAHPVLSQT